MLHSYDGRQRLRLCRNTPPSVQPGGGTAVKASSGFVDGLLDTMKILSHDIRSPLVNMSALLQLLIRGHYGALGTPVADELHKLSCMIHGLMGTLEDALGNVFSKECLTDSPMQRLHLEDDVLRPVLAELSKEMKDRRVVISCSPDPITDLPQMIRGNPFWLKSVFRNLIRNAIKYGGKDSRIAVRFETSDIDLTVKVYNSGRPIPEPVRRRLFEPFSCVSSEEKGHQGGLGLGLFFIRDIIQKHGGRIWYEPEEDGSTFVFTLPLE